MKTSDVTVEKSDDTVYVICGKSHTGESIYWDGNLPWEGMRGSIKIQRDFRFGYFSIHTSAAPRYSDLTSAENALSSYNVIKDLIIAKYPHRKIKHMEIKRIRNRRKVVTNTTEIITEKIYSNKETFISRAKAKAYFLFGYAVSSAYNNSLDQIVADPEIVYMFNFNGIGLSKSKLNELLDDLVISGRYCFCTKEQLTIITLLSKKKIVHYLLSNYDMRP